MTQHLADVVDVARRCCGYGMCKVDYLTCGICPAGRRHQYASYFPQGRMDIAVALHEGSIPVTPRLLHIVDTCTLCNICDRQCYFTTGLRSLPVMKALATYTEAYRRAGNVAVMPPHDGLVEDLVTVVGPEWVSNDSAVLVGYGRSRSPARPTQVPRCVVLPATADEVADVTRIANRYGVELVPRGNGTSLAGAMTDGIILDLARLSRISIDAGNWCAEVGAGVTAFALQRTAHQQGLRANTAEPAACVCANVISTNLHSLYSHSYGVGADNVIDARFVTFDGQTVHLGSAEASRWLTYQPGGTRTRPAAICTSMRVKLHPVPADEDAVVVPFADTGQALEVARQLGARRIGSAVGLVGSGYAARFMAASQADGQAFEEILRDLLGIRYVLIVVGDRYALDAVTGMCDPVLDSDTMRMLLLGLGNLRGEREQDLLADLDPAGAPFETLFSADMRPVLSMALRSGPEGVAGSVDEDMRRFFQRLYERPEMTDLRWLTTFRILSARIGRGKTFVPRIVWTPIDHVLIDAIVEDLSRVGDRHGISHDFGYLVPVDLGKRAILEFDFFYEQTDDEQRRSMVRVLEESQEVLSVHRERGAAIVPGHEIALQGISRPESYLYCG
jgi:hypothetical protein